MEMHPIVDEDLLTMPFNSFSSCNLSIIEVQFLFIIFFATGST